MLIPDEFSGELDRRAVADTVLVPDEIRISGDRLEWRVTQAAKDVRPTTEALRKFVGLSGADSEQILEFARTWGVLRICEHGLPDSHNPFRLWVTRGSLALSCHPLGWGKGDYCWEPLSAWHEYATEARTMLTKAEHLHMGQRTGDLKWERSSLRRLVNSWLDMGDVYLGLTWETELPEIKMGYSGLFGALAAQIMLTAVPAGGIATCTGCGLPFPWKGRRPAAGRRRYCQTCRDEKVPQLHAAQDWRRRNPKYFRQRKDAERRPNDH